MEAQNLQSDDTIMQHAKDIKALYQDIMEKLNTALNLDTWKTVKKIQHRTLDNIASLLILTGTLILR